MIRTNATGEPDVGRGVATNGQMPAPKSSVMPDGGADDDREEAHDRQDAASPERHERQDAVERGGPAVLAGNRGVLIRLSLVRGARTRAVGLTAGPEAVP